MFIRKSVRKGQLDAPFFVIGNLITFPTEKLKVAEEKLSDDLFWKAQAYTEVATLFHQIIPTLPYFKIYF